MSHKKQKDSSCHKTSTNGLRFLKKYYKSFCTEKILDTFMGLFRAALYRPTAVHRHTPGKHSCSLQTQNESESNRFSLKQVSLNLKTIFNSAEIPIYSVRAVAKIKCKNKKYFVSNF